MKILTSLLSARAFVLAPLFTFFTAAAYAQAPAVYINEIQVSTSGTDWEFVELQGAPGTSLSDLTLIGIESDVGISAGRIDRVISLAGQSIPADGFWLGMSPAGLSAYGVTGDMVIADNSFENSTATYFLVTGFTGTPGDDLDADDNGVLDYMPWTAVADSINIRDSGASDFDYGAPSVGPDGNFLPSGTYRCADAPFGTFGNNMHNFSTPDGTPGTNNRETCGIPEIYLNEIQVSTTSTDWEFFELAGPADADLSDLTLIGIESDFGTAAGTIDRVISLAGQSIPADGFWLGMSPAGLAAYGVAGDMGIADNTFENSTATYFLVTGFTGAPGDDLDVENDGVLDSMPWALVLDALNIWDSGASDLNYGAPSVGPDGNFLPSGTYRCPDAPDGMFGNNMHNFSTADGTPGVTNGCTVVVELKRIHDVQGSGDTSPLAGATVAIEGVVVGDFQDGSGANGDLNGFFVQEEDADADSDAATSEGIFVFDGSSPSVDVSVGDVVRVEGKVSEYEGLTEITPAVDVVKLGTAALPTVSTLALPVTAVEDFEAFEGMLVTFPQTLKIVEYFNFDRFGEMLLGSERRMAPTAEFDPGPDALAAEAAYVLDRIVLDDGRTSQNPDPAIHPNGHEFNLDNSFRGGDTLTDVTGVLSYAFGAYRVQPTQGANYVPVNERSGAPDKVGGTLKVASFNVLNYFTTLDDSGPICGPSADMGCRGADTEQEFTRQRNKIIAALAAIDADIFGLIEIENIDAATIDLVSGLNDVVGAGTYDHIVTGTIGSDAIRVALIYKPAVVSPVGDFAVLSESVDPLFRDYGNRPVLAQTFADNAAGDMVTVAVTHLRSKGSPCDDETGAGDDDSQGAGNCNGTRNNAAMAMVDWLAGDPTDSGSDNFLVIGDLNSYDMEDPIDTIVAGGYVDLIDGYLGDSAYGYLFNGRIGYIDHALASAGLDDQVTGTTIWHINADEPDLIDYDMSFKQDAQDALYAPDAYRSSDHDPVIVGLDLCENVPPQFDTLAATPNLLWPPNHKYVDVSVTAVASDNFDPNPTVSLLGVRFNEADNGNGDGDTSNDVVIVNDTTFKLRAERSGNGSGRIYTVTYEVTDSCGNSAIGSTEISVPKSQGRSEGKSKGK